MTLTLNVLSVTRPSLVTRISTAANGAEGDAASANAEISADGRYAVFASAAKNLGGGPVAVGYNIFRKNLLTDAVDLISAGLDGAAADGDSSAPSMSADGSRVAFQSYASNLVADDTNGDDIFVKDFATSSLFSITPHGNAPSYNPTMSANGQFVAFTSYASNLISGDTTDTELTEDTFVKNLESGGLVRIAGYLRDLTISDDGQYLTFSTATALVSGDDNGKDDVYRRNLKTNGIERLSVDSDGAGAKDGSSYDARFSADGHYMVFASKAAVQIATLNKNLKLKATDFFVV